MVNGNFNEIELKIIHVLVSPLCANYTKLPKFRSCWLIIISIYLPTVNRKYAALRKGPKYGNSFICAAYLDSLLLLCALSCLGPRSMLKLQCPL